MRAKQLAAIVGKRPWWDSASRIYGVFYRHHLSFGAAAALALTWAGVRYMGGPAQIVHRVPTGSRQLAVASAVPVHVAASAVNRASVSQDEIGVVAAQADPTQGPAAVSSVSHVTQAPPTAPAEAAARTPFGDGIAITLADFRETAPGVAKQDIFGSDREFEASAASANQPVSEPLARMDPSAERRARLLAPALPAYSSGSPRSLASDWIRTRASNDRMYESMDLYGSNDRAVVGFRF